MTTAGFETVGVTALAFLIMLVELFDWTDNRPLLVPDLVEDGLLLVSSL